MKKEDCDITTNHIIKVLLVDQDQSIYQQLKEILNNKIELDYIDNTLDGVSMFVSNYYPLVIASESFQEMSGLSFLRIVKKIDTSVITSIIIDSIDDKKELSILKSGISFIFTRHRSIDIMVHHVEHSIQKISCRRYLTSSIDGNGKININLDSHIVTVNNHMTSLTPKEFEILVLFLQNKNRVLERTEIINEIWKKPFEEVDERTVDVHIKRLRDKLKVHSIVSIRGFGYRWVEK